ncbi:hypothetical protein Leryth_024822 [Lithospermum erythrorhizon]|nr:hypothetical protein Leryth_024822 [Lithospermum erythrorhizon]
MLFDQEDSSSEIYKPSELIRMAETLFQTVAASLVDFYAMHAPLLPNPSGDGLKKGLMRTISYINCMRSNFPVLIHLSKLSLMLCTHAIPRNFYLCYALMQYFCRKKLSSHPGSDVMEDGIYSDLLSEAETAWAQREWSIQHILIPAMRLFLKPPLQ